MFLLDGHPISPDVAFVHNGVEYPANWLRLATPEERAEIGITEAPDPEPYDQRFYWGPDAPKDHAELVEQWQTATRNTAGTLLLPTDWMIIRQLDSGQPIDPAIKQWREDVRVCSREKVAAIAATASTEELAILIAGSDYVVWPDAPRLDDAVSPAPDGVGVVVNGETI